MSVSMPSSKTTITMCCNGVVRGKRRTALIAPLHGSLQFCFIFLLLACVFPVGLWYCIKNVNDERVFIILYAISAVYFAGVMVRLMLTLTPCVCILAAIAFSKLFSIYLKEDEAAKEAEDPETSEKNGRLYDKVLAIMSKERKIKFSITGWKNQKDEA